MFSRIILSATLLASTSLPLQAQVTKPVSFISRAEMAMSLVTARLQNVPVIRNTGQFSDVAQGTFFGQYLLYAERMGIVTANAERQLRPYASVTRAEFLKMLTLTFGQPVAFPHAYSDVAKDSWYDDYAGLAQAYKLFPESQSKLEPQRAVTRDEASRIIEFFRVEFERAQANAQSEQAIAQQQASDNLAIYTVISTRMQKVTLVDPNPVLPTLSVKVTPLPPPVSLPDLRTEILTLVNDIRTGRKLKPLTYSSQLEQSAQAYADRMINEGFFGHTAPDGEVLKDRVMRTGYYDRTFSTDCYCMKGYALGENLARGQKTPKEVVDAWMKSPSHRDAIINPDYTDLGVGVRSGIWVQHFGGVLLPK